jgi:hypothetical protein
MHRAKLTHTSIAAIFALAGSLFSNSTSAADFKAMDYDTPAYVDLEVGEVRVNEPAGTVSINILRTGDFRRTTTINYQTEEDTASEGQDYKGVGGSVTFRPGEGFKTITMEILADDKTESPESFRLEISGTGPNTMVFRSTASIVIEDAPVALSQPRLEIASAANGNIRLSWEGSDQCALERTTNPGAGNWESVSCSPTVAANRCEVLQPAGGTFFFYRLRTP